MKQQIIILDQSSDYFSKYLKELNDMLASGEWHVISQTCTNIQASSSSDRTYAVFSYVLQHIN